MLFLLLPFHERCCCESFWFTVFKLGLTWASSFVVVFHLLPPPPLYLCSVIVGYRYLANEVYIFQNGDTTTGGAAELAHSENAGGAAGQRNDIDDGNEHTAKIVYDRNVHKVFVYLDDMTRPLFNAQACSYLTRKKKVGTTAVSMPCIDVSAMADKATGEMWVGLIGSTGYVKKRL